MKLRNILSLFLLIFSISLSAQEKKTSSWSSFIDSLTTNNESEEMLEHLRNMPNIEVGKGISFEPKNKSYKMTMRFRMQNMASASFDDNFSHTETEARVKRLRLRFDGYIFSPKLLYSIQLGFSPYDAEVIPNGNVNIIRDAMVFYMPTNNFSIGFGQTKIKANRARVNSSSALQFVDRSIVNSEFNIDRDFGLFTEYYEKLSDVQMPASKLELLVKMLRKQIKEYGKTNQTAAKKFQEMLEETINQYHERRKHLTASEAGAAQEQATEDIIKNATEQALRILKDMNADRESFRKIGLTFEEKAFYDILMALRDEYNFEYGTNKMVDGIAVNDKCKALAKKIKEIIDTKSSFADWLNNQIVRDQLKFAIKVCLIKNGYPPQYSPEVFRKVMEQVENFEENS